MKIEFLCVVFVDSNLLHMLLRAADGFRVVPIGVAKMRWWRCDVKAMGVEDLIYLCNELGRDPSLGDNRIVGKHHEWGAERWLGVPMSVFVPGSSDSITVDFDDPSAFGVCFEIWQQVNAGARKQFRVA